MLLLPNMKFYGYEKCGTCRKAKRFLQENHVTFQDIAIREQPPSKAEIKRMIGRYGVKRLFNTSGQDYRNSNIKEKILQMSELEIIDLLSSNGNLIKRPFVIDKHLLVIGFNEEEWIKVFS